MLSKKCHVAVWYSQNGRQTRATKVAVINNVLRGERGQGPSKERGRSSVFTLVLNAGPVAKASAAYWNEMEHRKGKSVRWGHRLST